MARSPDESITVRRMRFTFPADLDPVICPGKPEESFVNVGLSLLLPYLEPYLIRSMREARKQLSDPALLADLDAFNAQEGMRCLQVIDERSAAFFALGMAQQLHALEDRQGLLRCPMPRHE